MTPQAASFESFPDVLEEVMPASSMTSRLVSQ
jgi:hypothetical protein